MTLKCFIYLLTLSVAQNQDDEEECNKTHDAVTLIKKDVELTVPPCVSY